MAIDFQESRGKRDTISASLVKKAALDLPEPNSERTTQSFDGLARVAEVPVAGSR